MKGAVKSRYAIENLSSEEVEGVRQLNLTEYIQGIPITHSEPKNFKSELHFSTFFLRFFAG